MSTIVTRSGKGSPLTHVEVDANFTNLNTDKYQEGSAIGAVTPAAGTFTTLTASALTATGQTSLGGAAGSEVFRAVPFSGNTGWWTATGNGVGNAILRSAGASTSSLIDNGSANAINFRTNAASAGVVQLSVSHTASAVNYVQVTGAATGGAPAISVQGSDANITAFYQTKGVGSHVFGTRGTTQQFRISDTGSAVNYLQAQGSAAGNGLQFSAQGSDTNISQVFQSKGTGAIDLAAGSQGVNISNGGTVTALTLTNLGTSGYTSFPSVAITAPTTAGGVQATASVSAMSMNGVATPVSGGTGYSVNDVLSVSGGTFSSVLQLRVTAVSGGVVTAVTYASGFGYTVLPTNPVSVTGGTGSGATFTIPWGIQSLTITNAGSGYVEQPTVSFSGGGGSGAAAYASVGSGTIVKSLGSTLSFSTPAGENFRVRDSGSTITDFPFAIGSSFGRPVLGATTSSGSGNASLALTAWGSGGILQFMTNNTAQEQMRVAHTASAVNYVQVTGAATANRPIISAQGSDANIGVAMGTKGTGTFSVLTDGSAFTGFVVSPRATNGDTWIETQRNVGFVDLIVASGVTNGDIRLTPKGTGNVRFGTLTASADAAITGYITIKDSGGTVRKLAVIA